MSLNGLFSLAPGESFTPLRSKEADALKCASCAAPLGPHEARCSYCLSWNPAYGRLGGIDAIEVTTMEDAVPRYLVGLESPVTGGYVGSSNPTAVLEAPGTISESERRAIEVLWRDTHAQWGRQLARPVPPPGRLVRESGVQCMDPLEGTWIKRAARWLLGLS